MALKLGKAHVTCIINRKFKIPDSARGFARVIYQIRRLYLHSRIMLRIMIMRGLCG